MAFYQTSPTEPQPIDLASYAFVEAALCDADIPVTARSAGGPGRLLVDR